VNRQSDRIRRQKNLEKIAIKIYQRLLCSHPEMTTVQGQERREIIYCKRPILCLASSKILTARRCVPPAFVAGGGHTRRVERGAGGQHFGRRKTQLCTLPISNPLWPRSRLFFTLINIAAGERRRIHSGIAQISTARRKWANADHGTMCKDRKSSSAPPKSKEQEGIGKYCLFY
jgi:hypothetical protein